MLNPDRIEVFDWIGKYRSKCRFDLSRNELFEQDLDSFGVDTSYESYLKEEDPENYFRSTVSELYDVESSNVLPTIGGSEAIFLASAYLGNISSVIHVPVPDYEPLFRVPQALGSRVIMSHTEKLEEDLEPDSSAMLTSPSNPEGRERRETLGIIADGISAESRIYVDETFLEFGFREKPESSFHTDEKVFTSNTMTKFFGLTKLRTGWIIAREGDMEKLQRYKSMTSASNPRYTLWLSANVLRARRRFSSLVRGMLEKNLPVADRFVSRHDYLKWDKPTSAPFGFVRYGMKIDSVTLCKKIFEDTGILLVPGSFLGEEGGFRLCFFLDPDDNAEAFEILGEYFDRQAFRNDP